MIPDILKKHIITGLKNKYGFLDVKIEGNAVIAHSKSGIQTPMGVFSEYQIKPDFVGNKVLYHKDTQVWRFMRIKKTSARKVLEKHQIDYLSNMFS